MPVVSIVLPAYDEVESLASVVDEARDVLRSSGIADAEILIVDDGSTDGTAALADDLARRYENVRTVHHSTNLGFGGAMKTCFREARGDWIFLAAADGQIPIAMLPRFLRLKDTADVVIGVRERRADAPVRQFLSWGFHFAARALLSVPQREFSSAFLFSGELLRGMCLRSGSRAATVLPEVLYRARRRGARVAEVVIEHRPRRAGRAKGAGALVIMATFVELARLAVVLRLERKHKR